MNGVIYARYSSDNQREESIEGQIRECMEYAEKQGITVLGTYIDRAFSAKTDNRPEFQRMIKDSAKKLFDVVIVWKLDRFARNRYDSAHYKNVLRKNGIRLLSAKENISDGPEGIILESMLEGFAEYYSAELAVKVTRGMTENALKCRSNGGTITYGYVIDAEQKYQIDPLAAPIVLEVFQRYSDGATIQQIVDYLKGIGASSGRGGKITVNTVAYMLKNRKYIGEYKFHDIVVPDGIPAIVPKELFNRVQERREKNKRAPSRHKAEDDYILTTKLHCGKCGVFMVGESGTSQTSRKYHYYKCTNAKKRPRKCDKKTVKKDWIESLVIKDIMSVLMNDSLMEQLADKLLELQSKENTHLPLLQKQLVETQRAIDNMLNAIQQGVLTSSTKQRLDDLESQKSDIETSILQEQIKQPSLTKEQILFWLHKFRSFDVSVLEQRQKLIDCFVNAIYLYDDRIVLTFNYKDGTKHITFDEVNSSDLPKIGRPSSEQGLHRLLRLFLQKSSRAHAAALPLSGRPSKKAALPCRAGPAARLFSFFSFSFGKASWEEGGGGHVRPRPL